MKQDKLHLAAEKAVTRSLKLKPGESFLLVTAPVEAAFTGRLVISLIDDEYDALIDKVTIRAKGKTIARNGRSLI